MTTIHLIDASPYIFRAWFALPDSIRDGDGRPAQAVYGFATFLLKYAADASPTHCAVAFDRSLTSSFRNEFFPDYKAQRPLPPPELEAQLRDCEELAAALGFATFVDDHFEADDLIATILRQVLREGDSAVVVSSDKDLAQLVTDRVTLFDFGKGIRYSPADVESKFGVAPTQIVDYLALAGDPVDNIPGVRGIGGKSAAALLQRFGSLERTYASLDEVATMRGGSSLRAKLESSREIAFLSKRLATATDAQINVTLDDLVCRGVDRDRAAALFDRLRFRTLSKRVLGV